MKHSDSTSRLSFQGSGFAGVCLALLLHAGIARAEDPLLGRIKNIKCVGCDPGAVNLVVHDPIDVRDFEVQIKESDYQKIITPLPGKTVYEKDGCFYWMDAPKRPKPTGKEPVKPGKSPGQDAKVPGPGADSAKESGDSMEASEAPQGTPSRCIPYVRLQPKSSNQADQKDEE